MPSYGGSTVHKKTSKKAEHHAWYDPRSIAHDFNYVGSGLVNDIKSLRGVPAGLAYQAKEISNGHTGKMLSELGHSLAKEYKYNYGPALSGDFGTTAHRVGKHPLNPILDATSIALLFAGPIGWAGDAAILGSRGVEAGSLAARGARLAGKEAVIGEHAFRDAAAAGRTPVVTKSGVVYAQKTRKLVDAAGSSVHEIPLPRNPAARAKILAKEVTLAKLAPTGSRLSPAVRGVRLSEKAVSRQGKRSILAAATAAHTAIMKVPRAQRETLTYMAEGFRTTADFAALKAHRVKRIAELAPTPKGAARDIKIANLKHDLKTIEKAVGHIAKPHPAMTDALQHMQALADLTTASQVKRGVTDIAGAESRRHLPREQVDLAPNPDAFTVSHHELRSPKDMRRGTGGVSPNAQDKYNSGANFLDARYSRNPLTVVDSYSKEMRLTGSLNKVERMTQHMHTATPELLANPDMMIVGKETEAVKQVFQISEFMKTKLEPFAAATGEDIKPLRDMIQGIIDQAHAGDLGMVIDKSVYREFQTEMKGAAGLAARLMGTAMSQWRHLVLSLKGTFYVNNFLGNMLLGMVAHPIKFPAALVRESFGGSLSKDIKAALPDIRQGSQGVALTKSASKVARERGLAAVGGPLARTMARFTDDNFRRAMFRVKLGPYVKMMQKGYPDLSRHEIIQGVFNDEKALDYLAQKMYGDMLDYGAMTESERKYLVPFYPFWAFTRSMAGRTIRLGVDEPWKLKALEIWGNYGIEANHQQVGNLPDFAQGMLLLDGSKMNPKALSTAGVNPFSAPIDTAQQLGSILGINTQGEGGAANPIASMSPLVKMAIEGATGKDMFYGTDLPQKTFAGRAGHSLLNSLPPYVTYDKMANPSMNPTVIRTPLEQMYAYAGYPIGHMNVPGIRSNMAIAAQYDRKDAAKLMRRLAKRQARHKTLTEILHNG